MRGLFFVWLLSAFISNYVVVRGYGGPLVEDPTEAPTDAPTGAPTEAPTARRQFADNKKRDSSSSREII